MSQITIQSQTHDDPYADLIAKFVGTTVPAAHTNSESVVEAIVQEFVGSRQIRQGPAPTPESLVAMKKVVRYYMEHGRPIPVLIPSAPKKKKIGASVDLAEFMMLQTIKCLQHRVSQHHAPGLEIVVRLENNTGAVLEEGIEGALESMSRYMADLSALNYVLGTDQFLTFVPESQMADTAEFAAKARSFFPLIDASIDDPEAHAKELTSTGWQSGIKREMLDYQERRYRELFPSMDEKWIKQLIVKYISCIIARLQLNSTGNRKTWDGGHLHICHVPPTPHSPASLTNTRVFYRTLPMSHSRLHKPYWGGHGVLQIDEAGSSRVKFADWDDPDLHMLDMVLSRGGTSVKLATNYMLVD